MIASIQPPAGLTRPAIHSTDHGNRTQAHMDNAKGETRTAWSVDYPDVGGAWQRKQFASKREADDFRIRIEGEVRSGTFRPEAGKITVKEISAMFLDDCEERLARASA